MQQRTPYWIQSLVDGFAGKCGKYSPRCPYPLPLKLTYSHEIQRDKQSFTQIQNAYKSISDLQEENTIALVNQSLMDWSSYAKVTFTRTKKTVADFYLAQSIMHEPFIQGTTHLDLDLTSFEMMPTSLHLNAAFIQESTQPHMLCERANLMYVISHELGHTLRLSHPFEPGGNFRDTLFPFSQHNTWYSLMNYRSKVNSNFQPVYRVSPSAFDIQSVQFLYGTKPARLGNDTYDLTASGFSLTCPTVKTIYDCGGINTFSVENYTGTVKINLRNDVDLYSQVGEQYITQSFETVIHNVIGGKGENTIVLNAENNNVVLDTLSTHPSTITTFRYDQGIDTLHEFNPARRDRIIIQTPTDVDGTNPMRVMVEPLTENAGTKITINEHNIIHLPNTLPQEITEKTILLSHVTHPYQCAFVTPIVIRHNRFLDEVHWQTLKTMKQPLSFVKWHTDAAQEMCFTQIDDAHAVLTECKSVQPSSSSSILNWLNAANLPTSWQEASTQVRNGVVTALPLAGARSLAQLTENPEEKNTSGLHSTRYYATQGLCLFAIHATRHLLEDKNPTEALANAAAETIPSMGITIGFDAVASFATRKAQAAYAAGNKLRGTTYRLFSKGLEYGTFAYQACSQGVVSLAASVGVGVIADKAVKAMRRH